MDDIFEELAAAVSDEEGRVDEGNQPAGNGEAEEVDESRRLVKPKRTISRPRPKLDPARLLGPRGIFVVTSTFDGVKFKGKGHELDDLNNILSRLQHWAHRLFPKMTFEDCIDRIEELGNKREIQTNMHKIRMGMIDLDGQTNQADGEAADDPAPPSPPPAVNPFDQLIAAAPPQPNTLTDEQRARMMRNRLLAEERRMARRLAREKELEEQRRSAHDSTQNTITPHEANGGSPSSSRLEEQRREILDTEEGPTTSVPSASMLASNGGTSSTLFHSTHVNTSSSIVTNELFTNDGNSALTILYERSLLSVEASARENLSNPTECAYLSIPKSDSSPQTGAHKDTSLPKDMTRAPGLFSTEAEVITNPMEPLSCAMETDD